MEKTDTKNEKRTLLSVIMEDSLSIIKVVLRLFLAVLVCGFFFIIPFSYAVVRVLSLLTLPFSSFYAGLIGFILFFLFCLWLGYCTRNGNSIIAIYIMTGHFQLEVSDERNRHMRQTWLKLHKNKERIRPHKWNIDITNTTEAILFNPVYPVDHYGREEKNKDPLCYQTIIPITHKFFGDLPVKGDTISFSWKFISNNDIKSVRARIIEFSASDNTNPDSQKQIWRELDEKGTDGIIIAENLKTGSKNKISGSIKLGDKALEKAQLCIWYKPEDAHGESVFKYEF